MDVEEKTETEVRRRLNRLEDRYGTFEVHEVTVENDPDFFEHGKEMAKEGWIGDAGAWVTDGEGQVLMIRHEGEADEWGIPGGGHEPGETMEETARREVREETGVECAISDVNFARRKTIVLESNPEERYYMLTVVFDARYKGGTIAIGDEEILEAKWFSEPPENVLDFVREEVAEWESDN